MPAWGSIGLLAVVLSGVASAWPFASEKIKVRVDPRGKHSFALYGIPDIKKMDREIFWAITKPHEMAPVEVDADSAFVLRSTDMKFRVIVIVDLNDDPGTKASHPYKLCFFNTMLDPGASIELKHSTSGFVWIEEGTHLCQITDHSHNFELRDRKKVAYANIKVGDPRGEL